MSDSIQLLDLQRQYLAVQPAVDRAIAEVIASAAFINGPQVAQLEALLAGRIGVAHCLACANGTDAIWLALRGLGIGPGDEVITTPFTFYASAEAICLAGATPVFADIDPGTFALDPAAVAAAVTVRTRAILSVSLFGQLADMTALQAIADRHSLALVEDAAQSFGAAQDGRRSGAFGVAGCTSFFPAKPFGCYGDGGAVFTDDDTLLQEMRLLREHGMERRDHYVRVGTNSRLDTLQAAILLAKYPLLDDELAARRRIAARYDAGLADRCTVPAIGAGNDHVYGVYTVRVADRDRVVDELVRREVPVRVYYRAPLHLQPALADLGGRAGQFPVAERACTEVMSLPLQPYLGEAQVERVIDTVRTVIG